MTDERKQDVWLIALVVSLVVHIGVMYYAQPKVMTHIAYGVARAVKGEVMRVTRDIPKPAPVRIDEVADVKATREAPKAEDRELSVAETEIATSETLPVPKPVIDAPIPEVVEAKPDLPVFSDATIKLDDVVSSKLPMKPIETPVVEPKVADVAGLPSGKAKVNAEAGAPMPDLPMPTIGADADSMFLPSALKISQRKQEREKQRPEEKTAEEAKAEEFKPVEEVLAKVDAKVVEQEKAAVKKLVDADDAQPLATHMNITMTTHTDGAYTYFKVMIMPKRSLPIVSKDYVVIIDASGSIGKDRMRSIKNAAKELLRSASNTGDRFNLVAFRDRFNYAFRKWQGCGEASFAAADKWLDDLAPHGRTDVFDTIASVLTLPRTPERPLIALVITDGQANTGVSDTTEILSRFTALNDGLISVYMYGVKSSANRELIDVLTHCNRGDSYIFDGWLRSQAGNGIGGLAERFRDPVLSDIRIVFSANTPTESYPRLLKNLYRNEVLEFYGRIPAGCKEVAFSVRGLNGSESFEDFFKLPVSTSASDREVSKQWCSESALDSKLKSRKAK